jgi:hypothetical protein
MCIKLLYVLSRVLVTHRRGLDWRINLLDIGSSLTTINYNTLKITVIITHTVFCICVNYSLLGNSSQTVAMPLECRHNPFPVNGI